MVSGGTGDCRSYEVVAPKSTRLVAFTSVVQVMTADKGVIDDALTAEMTGRLATDTAANALLLFPAPSVAVAVIECVPLATVFEPQVT